MNVTLVATPVQQEMINCDARFQGWFMGRRWGKTDTFFNRSTKRLLEAPIRYTYIAPGYPLAKEQYERCVDLLRPFIRRHRAQPKPEIWLTNGSRIAFRSFDKPKHIKGTWGHEVFVDEIQEFKDETTFWAVIRPLISDHLGTLIVAGQFTGHNWYYKQFFEKGQRQNQNVYKSWKLPTSTGLKFQTEAGKEELRLAAEQLPRAVYLQQYECEALSNQSAVFLPEDLKIIKRGASKTGPERGKHYILIYDLGEMVNPSALGVWEYETGTCVHAEKIPLRIKHAMQAKKVAETARRWGNAQVVIDATSGGAGGQKTADENVKHYRKLIPDLRAMVWGPSLKQDLVRKLSLAIENYGLHRGNPDGPWVNLSIPEAFTDTHNELEAFEFERQGEGYIYHAPKGGFDDQVAMCMMGVHAMTCGWIKTAGSNDLTSVIY